jgi:hypothetical protein
MTTVQLDALMQECLGNCTECHKVCLQTAVSVDVVGKLAPDDLKLLLNCAEVCRTCADFIATVSQFHPLMCGTCAQICEACAQMCRRYSTATTRECADVCERCADSCRRMAAAMSL